MQWLPGQVSSQTKAGHRKYTPCLCNFQRENYHINRAWFYNLFCRDIFLGTRECQGYIEPCVFGQGEGAYDSVPRMDFGLMYHGITYADEAYDEATKEKMTARFWRPVMENGIIRFSRPEDCPHHKALREMEMKPFGEALGNFAGLREFGEVT